jgi:hypothetical protein
MSASLVTIAPKQRLPLQNPEFITIYEDLKQILKEYAKQSGQSVQVCINQIIDKFPPTFQAKLRLYSQYDDNTALTLFFAKFRNYKEYIPYLYTALEKLNIQPSELNKAVRWKFCDLEEYINMSEMPQAAVAELPVEVLQAPTDQIPLLINDNESLRQQLQAALLKLKESDAQIARLQEELKSMNATNTLLAEQLKRVRW